MSTKINVRSPFFLSLTEPVQTKGVFTCTTAGLSNFAVQSSGLINNPNISKGRILDQSEYGFSPNTGTSVISRSVTYTIIIPPGYTNSNDSTIDCVQTIDQPFQTAQENPNDNNTCPTVSSQPSDLTGISPSSAQIIDVDTLFSPGAGQAIGSYEVIRVSGSISITAVISGTGNNVICTMQSQTSCITGEFRFKAINTSGSCSALTDSFSFTTSGCVAFDCDDVALVAGTGRVEQDGTVHKSEYASYLNLNKLLFGSIDISTSLNVGANNTGSPRTITLTYRINIPIGYTNSGTFDCNVDYQQLSSATARTFGCGDAQIKAPFVSQQGSISNPTTAVTVGTYVSHSPSGFDTVSSNTPRTITFIITPPASGWANSGGNNISCDVPVTQPALIPVLGNTSFFASRSYNSLADICSIFLSGELPQTFIPLRSTATSFLNIHANFGQIITSGSSLFRGNNEFYIYTETPATIEATTIFKVLKINNNGSPAAIINHICTYAQGV